MIKLTEKQLDKFYNVIMDSLTHGHVNDFFLNGDTRLSDKLENAGIIVVVETEERDCFQFYASDKYAIDTDLQAVISESGYALAMELFGDIYAQKRERNYSRNACPKCGGKGYIVEYGHIAKGVCFKCNGSGRK